MLLVQQDDLLKTGESRPQVHGYVCFYSPGRGETFRYTCCPTDWLGKEGSYNTLAGWLEA